MIIGTLLTLGVTSNDAFAEWRCGPRGWFGCVAPLFGLLKISKCEWTPHPQGGRGTCSTRPSRRWDLPIEMRKKKFASSDQEKREQFIPLEKYMQDYCYILPERDLPIEPSDSEKNLAYQLFLSEESRGRACQILGGELRGDATQL